MVNNKKNKQPKVTTKVSIVTVTQIKRKETIKILVDHIKNQTYRDIVQWVIVEGSSTSELGELNATYISEIAIPGIVIDYIPWSGNKLGQLRNSGNAKCTGDITVCMDDDDYYPPTRVEHCVKMLSESSCLIAGCSAKYLYDYCLQRFYLFKPFGPNHSTNDCMAWKKEFITSTRGIHDPNAGNAEEMSFTSRFTEPMVQLSAEHTIVGSSHRENTFNKKEICVFGCIGIYPNVEVLETLPKMESSIFERYCDIYRNDTVSEYDIVYFTGGTSIDWCPKDKTLGGSEQAVVHLASEWVKLGLRVAVYGKIADTVHLGVDYFDWKKFDYSGNYNTLILWRLAGVNGALQFPIKTKKLFVDLHDNIYQFRFNYQKYADKIDKIFFKSEYHLNCYQDYFKQKLEPGKFEIIMNGIRIDDFKNSYGIARNPYRFVYCSCYTRGLENILLNIWPTVYANEPRAELHVYYGMNYVTDQAFKNKMTLLMGQPGVMDHGRQPMETIIREKWQSSFHLYITDTTGEIDCISIRESLVCGCIPLLSRFGVFEQRDGVHFGNQNICQGILNLLQKTDFVESSRSYYQQSKTIVSWETVAKEWKTLF